MASVGEGAGNIQELFNTYLETIFPFTKKDKAQKDTDMIATMKKEVAKGAIMFQSQALPNPFKDKAKRMQLAPGVAETLRSKKPLR